MNLSQGLAAGRLAISRRKLLAYGALPFLALFAWFPSEFALAQEVGSSSAGPGPGTDSTALRPLEANANTAPGLSVPALQLSGSIAFEEAYTTNALGAYTGTSGTSDTYTRGILQLGARYNSLRTHLLADYSFFGDY
jgi:hypothetical protein